MRYDMQKITCAPTVTGSQRSLLHKRIEMNGKGRSMWPIPDKGIQDLKKRKRMTLHFINNHLIEVIHQVRPRAIPRAIIR